MILKKILINFLSNSVFGKSIQSDANKQDICIVTNGKRRNKQASSIYFKEINIIKV